MSNDLAQPLDREDLSARAEARATREGLITFGVVMSGVLLSAALLVWAVRRPVR